jgi:hypothetical protein
MGDFLKHVFRGPVSVREKGVIRILTSVLSQYNPRLQAATDTQKQLCKVSYQTVSDQVSLVTHVQGGWCDNRYVRSASSGARRIPFGGIQYYTPDDKGKPARYRESEK